VTIALRPAPSKPLPIAVRPAIDELLSSWLRRTAHVYTVTAVDVLVHFGIVWPDPLRQADFAQSARIKARLAWALRTTTARIQRAGHPVSAWRANELVAIDIPFSRCAACEQTWSSGSPALRPYSRSWYEAWRVKCGICGRPFHLGNSSAPNPDAILVTDRLWRDAVDGSELFERYLLGCPCGLAAASLDLVTGVDSDSTSAQIADGFWTDRSGGLSTNLRDAAGDLRHDLPHPQPVQAGCHDGCGPAT